MRKLSPLSLYGQFDKLFKKSLISSQSPAASTVSSNPLYQSFTVSSMLPFLWLFIFLLILIFFLILFFTLLPHSVGSCLLPHSVGSCLLPVS